MKGKYIVIGRNGEKYHYRYLANAFNKYYSIWANEISVKHIDTHLLSL